MGQDEPKDSALGGSVLAAPLRPSHLASLGLGLACGAVGGLPAMAAGVDSFALLAWIAFVAPAAGAFLGALRVDPWRFGAVAPAAWAVVLALVAAAEERASLPTPIFGALAWGGLFFAGMAVGRSSGAAAASSAALLLASALLVGLPVRGGIRGEPWSPPVASALLDFSPFVLLGECSGARDMAWHPSLYAAAGTDRFQRAPWRPAPAGSAVLALGLGLAILADRRARRAPAAA